MCTFILDMIVKHYNVVNMNKGRTANCNHGGGLIKPVIVDNIHTPH